MLWGSRELTRHGVSAAAPGMNGPCRKPEVRDGKCRSPSALDCGAGLGRHGSKDIIVGS